MEGEITTLRALFAVAAIELGTDLVGESMVSLDELPIFVDSLFRQKCVPVQALVASIAVPVLLEEFTKRLPMLQVLVQEGAVLAFFA